MYDLSGWVIVWRVKVKRCAALVLAPENVKREGGRWLTGCEGLREHKDAGFIESQVRGVLIIFHQLEFGTRFYSTTTSTASSDWHKWGWKWAVGF